MQKFKDIKQRYANNSPNHAMHGTYKPPFHLDLTKPYELQLWWVLRRFTKAGLLGERVLMENYLAILIVCAGVCALAIVIGALAFHYVTCVFYLAAADLLFIACGLAW